METLRKIIEEKKRKGEEKKPYYGIRKLSVGIVSCMLGHLLFFASPVVVSAVEATPEDVSIIQMQSVKGDVGCRYRSDRYQGGFRKHRFGEFGICSECKV